MQQYHFEKDGFGHNSRYKTKILITHKCFVRTPLSTRHNAGTVTQRKICVALPTGAFAKSFK